MGEAAIGVFLGMPRLLNGEEVLKWRVCYLNRRNVANPMGRRYRDVPALNTGRMPLECFGYLNRTSVTSPMGWGAIRIFPLNGFFCSLIRSFVAAPSAGCYWGVPSFKMGGVLQERFCYL